VGLPELCLSPQLPSGLVQSLGIWTWTGAMVETDRTRWLAASRTVSRIIVGSLSASFHALFQARSAPA
jgi:hypothetical protein